MAADDLPQFDASKNYVLSGKTLNQIIAAIKARTILDSAGVEIIRTPNGVTIKAS